MGRECMTDGSLLLLLMLPARVLLLTLLVASLLLVLVAVLVVPSGAEDLVSNPREKQPSELRWLTAPEGSVELASGGRAWTHALETREDLLGETHVVGVHPD